MNPSDANSPLATLRQLKEMLDAGTITPQEFEALKQQLVFGQSAGTTASPAAMGAANTPSSPAEPAPFSPSLIPEATPASPEVAPPPFEPALASAEVIPAAPTPGTPETPDWLAAAAPMLLTHDAPAEPEAERRNPLTLVFAVGGALVLLAIVLYLALGNRTESEHISSISQTAADSTKVAPEEGPQSEQINLPPAAPETIRVAPATPPPVAPSAAATRFRADSVAAPAAIPVAPAAKAPAAPVAADTAI